MKSVAISVLVWMQNNSDAFGKGLYQGWEILT